MSQTLPSIYHNEGGLQERNGEGVHLGHCLHEKEWGEVYVLLPAINTKIDAILEQAKLTNGRIRSLESVWSFVKGAMAVIILLEMLPKLLSALVAGHVQ